MRSLLSTLTIQVRIKRLYSKLNTIIFIETLAMKALILNGMKKKPEAYAMIQKALFSNMKNFSCWHVYGLLNKSHK